MGISIHYRGKLDDITLLPSLVEEMKDIAKSMDWAYAVFDDEWDEEPNAYLSKETPGLIEGNLGFRGLQLTPSKDSEPLVLLFDREGRLRSPMDMIRILDGSLDPEQATISMKTQFAPSELHVFVIGLLKYLKKIYISNLEVSDESGYWETGDRAELERKRNLIADKIESASAQLSSPAMPDWSNLTAEEIADRIERMLRG